MKYYIYTLEHKSIVFYIGKTIDLKTRLRKHISESKLKRTYKENFINKIILNNGTIDINIIDIVELGSEDYWEIYWIEQFKQWGFKLCNGTIGGEGGDNWSGRKHSEETKEKIRINRRKQIKDGLISLIPLPGEFNGRSKLKNEQVIEIRKLREEKNISYGKLALKFGVSKSVIIKIVNRKSWSHI
jgi:hypothetical protein